MFKMKAWLASAMMMLAIAGCGGGGGDAGRSVFEPGTDANTGSGTSSASAQALALSVQLLDGSGTATTNLVAGNTLRVKVTLTKSGVVQRDQLVKLSLDQQGNYAVLSQLTALTDANGVAVVTLSPGTVSGAGRVNAVAELLDGSSVEGAANFIATATAQNTSTLTLANFSVDSANVSAYGTTGFSVRVLSDGVAYGVPVTVTFSSDCAAGKAIITSSAVTSPAGVAVGTFEDLGCATSTARNVVLTASISTDSEPQTITVQPSTAGSLRFVSVSPSDASITLRGQGGTGRQENAQLVFRLVDQAGNGVRDTDVCFDSTTYIGGLTLDGFGLDRLPTNQGSAQLCGSDAISQIRYVKRTDANGNVSVQIASGTVPTPVRVRARAIYPAAATSALTTFSDALSVSTGLPLQRSFSLSVDKANIDGGNGTAGLSFDGETAVLTVRLADQFSNPVPDGTKVNFVASGGAVCTSQNGSCSTINGSCSCSFTTQNRRPLDGRVVVLAYADGLEDYIDANGNNQYDNGETFTDLADAFVDANKTEAYTGTSSNQDLDTPIPFQSPANYAAGNGTRGNAHIRASTILYLSAPTGNGNATAVVLNAGLSQSWDLANSSSAAAQRYVRLDTAGGCPEGSTLPQATFSLRLDDGFGNPLAAGTTLSAVDFTDNLASRSLRPSSVLAFGARTPSSAIDGPGNGVGNVVKTVPWSTTSEGGNVTTPHSVTIQGVTDKCSGTASFALQADSPRGAAELVQLVYEGEDRDTARSSFDVRYMDVLEVGARDTSISTADTAELDAIVASLPAGRTIQSYSIDWDDNSAVTTGTSLPIPINDRRHQFAATGTYDVRVTVTDSEGQSYSAIVRIGVAAP